MTETVTLSPGIISSGAITSATSAFVICGLSVIEMDTAFNVALPALFVSVSLKDRTIRSTFIRTSRNGTGEALRNGSV